MRLDSIEVKQEKKREIDAKSIIKKLPSLLEKVYNSFSVLFHNQKEKKKMKNVSKILVLALVLTVLLTACGPKEADKLTIGTSADFPPFEYIDENGDFAGFDIDLINKMSEIMGVEIEIVDMPFDSLVASVQEGKIDMSVAA